jgi:hypothetical protein
MNERMTHRSNIHRRSGGQSLIVAVIVMFVLLFIGGIFVGLVARNLINSGRSRDTIRALEFAKAGVQYCDQFLMNSPEGADWRPSPTMAINPQDPDIRWLQTGEWTRVQLNGGRVLVRVTYLPQFMPDPTDPLGQRSILDPLSRRIKIEAIGRVGFLDPNDPTTFLNTPAPRLRRELVAYKSIGLTDYLFYVTNRWNDSKARADIGIPAVSMRLPTNYTGPRFPLAMELGNKPIRPGTLPWPVANKAIGAPIYSNAPVNFVGDVRLAINQSLGEGVLAAGPVSITPNDATNPPLLSNLVTGVNGPVRASNDPTYSTFGGVFRDDSPSPDNSGYPRSVTRLDPPLLDYVDQSSGMTRYRLLSRNSGPTVNNVNTGRIGMGAGVYIDNEDDTDRRRPETNTLPLRTVWLSGRGPGWDGPYYIPRGVFLDFGYPVVQARDANTSELIADQYVATPGVRIVRDANDRNWRDPAGRFASTKELNFTFFIYKGFQRRPVLKLECEFFRSALRQAPFNMTEKEIDRFLPEFNGVLYTEGNARVRGLLPSKLNVPIRREQSEGNITDAQIYDLVNSPAISIVSGDDIYIEGSLVRESPDSMIALMAQNYVVLNTTMFVAENQAGPFETSTGANNTRALTYNQIDTADATRTPPWTIDLLYGDNPALYSDVNGNGVGQQLMLYHGVPGIQNGATYVNLFINDWFSRASNSPRYMFRTPSAGDPGDYYEIRSENTDNGFRMDVFPVSPKPNSSTYLFTGDAGYGFSQGLRNSYRLQVDPNFTQTAGTQPYLFSRAAIVPSDIRIEAVIYAQNESFFVIPGLPFNDNASDIPEAAVARAAPLNDPQVQMVRPVGTSHFVPFFREPIDCRITIVGAISQNRTAPVTSTRYMAPRAAIRRREIRTPRRPSSSSRGSTCLWTKWD